MPNSSLYRVGGTALAVGAVLQAVAILLHAPQPMDLVTYGTVAGNRWIASHWLFVAGMALSTGGLLSLARHLFTTKAEGWAVVGMGAILASSALFIAVVAPELVAFPALVQSPDAGAAQVYTAINLNLMSNMHVALPVYWFGIGALAYAMSSDAGFPRALAQVGVVVAVVELLAGFLITNWTVFKLLFLAAFVWLAVTGVMLRRQRAAVPAF